MRLDHDQTRRINEIVHGQRRISADTALRLARRFGISERFWINLQSRYDLEVERTGSVMRSMASARSQPPAGGTPSGQSRRPVLPSGGRSN